MIQDYIREIKAETFVNQNEIIRMQADMINELYGLLFDQDNVDEVARRKIDSGIRTIEKLKKLWALDGYETQDRKRDKAG